MELSIQLTCRYERLNEYVASIQDEIRASGAASVVIQNDKIVNDWYCGYHDNVLPESTRPISAKSQFNVASVRKTYLGFAVSIAIHEGKISSIDDPITYYLDELDKDLYRGTKIRHLLTHTHGVRYTERLFPAGTDWTYNNCGVDLLIKLIAHLYQCSLAQLMEERAFKPYGFTETGWRAKRTAHLVWQDESYLSTLGTEANLFVSARELAYWGYLHLGSIKEQDTQIIDPNVFRQAVISQTPDTLTPFQPRNGFFWFVQETPSPLVEIGEALPSGSFQILGVTGCACLVIPQYDIVAVRMYNQKGQTHGYDYLKDIKTWGNLVLECGIKHI